jgi:hypothetical protein
MEKHIFQGDDFYQQVKIAATNFYMFELVRLGCIEMGIVPKDLELDLRYNFSKFDKVKTDLAAKNLPTQHIEMAENFLIKNADPKRLHNFKIFCENISQEQQTKQFTLTSNLFMNSTYVTLGAFGVGICFQNRFQGDIQEANKKTGGECKDLTKIRAENPFTLSTQETYKAGQCFTEVPQQEHFYNSVGHNVFWANASMVVACTGMLVMIASGISSIRGLSNSGKN